MNKKMTALAALTLLSGLAAAQSTVTLYGTVDLGLMVNSKTAAGTSSTSLDSGGIAPSIWGLRGTEDLGGGLKVGFNLEGHLNPDTGTSVNGLFRRQSNLVVSSSDWGAVTIGNQYSPAILAFAATEPRGLRENFSGLYHWAFNSDTNGLNGNDDVGVFLQNAISYSNNFGPVKLAAGYGLKENVGSVLSLGATYTGPVTLSAAYQSANSAATGHRANSLYTLGAAYAMGDLTAKVNYLRGKNQNAAQVQTSDVGVVGLGLDWKTSAQNTVLAALYLGKDKDNAADKTHTFILGNEYALSKRTTAYGQVAFINAKAGATAKTSATLTPGMAGETSTQLNVGIKHAF
ncbi:porin [Aquabacterium sp. A08]|uniref:porin n=1 Tax=Aquabacterium sp. A08 TaxID=2718532 RepID=UPI00142097BA|nr:porin [Aquabacterium sp. A08]NIC41118.1 porin [Aquabacterium sp. A08]NIC41143.1 porin [Aquabacterium sp. A08]